MAEPAHGPRPELRERTYQDLVELPEHLVGELIGGELFASPRPAIRHLVAASGLGGELFNLFHRRPGGPSGPGGWWILDEPELHFGRDVMVPDLAGWRRERLPRLPDEAWLTVTPDWVCEILSPSTVRRDRLLKAARYARQGVGHMWLLDPDHHLLEVYRRVDDTWLRLGVWSDNDQVRAEPFEAVELDMGRWWPDEPEADEPPATHEPTEP